MDTKNYYGNLKETEILNRIDVYIEELHLKGFTFLDERISESHLGILRKKIDEIYEQQKSNLGENILYAINEIDMCRAPLLYDNDFFDLVTYPIILKICKQYLGDFFILNLQNAIINRPNLKHHQSMWHRDIPYQNFLTTRPISVNAFIVIDEFAEVTGSTQFLPFSHKFENLPSQDFMIKNKISLEAPPGTIIMFDSMLLHRAGFNKSNIIRRAINQMYSIPSYRQQYNFAKAFQNKFETLSYEQLQILGFNNITPNDDIEWRMMRYQKLNNEKK